MRIRNVKEGDYSDISPVINNWWGGRDMSDMVPKLFFVHFTETSFIAEEDGKVVGFLIGFLSQTYPDEAYIHFAGVHPEYRRSKIGRKLYEQFFSVVLQQGRSVIRAVTSPVNKDSVNYHKRMGFELEKGDKELNGIPVHTHYDGIDQSRVLFMKYFQKEETR
ncbi:GNAT family N-acetyltransferase [Halobacillus salinarum]|uniref:GNAT family N-acetyltransferase n=1 Tax=Halobacillus salinarum TaxID=2932257 RepID=A0ABY4EGW3_9BACI|nr:GNAT family N-acetyltransferase [Halobacillus salinarum]UOQ42869.1 GNAT family N-acetyltransferase [Halobacillus salinarum]